jgi:hypothetical protein
MGLDGSHQLPLVRFTGLEFFYDYFFNVFPVNY